MSKLFKKILIPSLTLLSIFSLTACKEDNQKPGGNTPNTPETQKPEDEKPGENTNVNFPKFDNLVKVEGDYEIFPHPQKISYLEDGFKFDNNKVNIIIENDIDKISKERLEDILEANNINNYEYTNSFKDNYLNILVGINNSNQFVDKFLEDNFKEEDNLFSKNDSYQLLIENGVIAILGSDLTSAFYGINTLNEVLSYIDNETLINAKISDYADGKLRGIVEGYYGNPWTKEARIDAIEWGSYYKMSNYVFAPKDDKYHSEKWRESYPKEELDNMKAVVDAAINNKVDFTWAIHPFMHNGFDFNNYTNDIKVITTKFEQLYSIGVRSFALSADDIAIPENEKTNHKYWENLALNHLKVVDDILTWGETKEDEISLQFVPTVYCGYNEADDETMGLYLETIGKNANEKVSIHWTGEQVYGKLNADSLKIFTDKTNRAPLFWLNSPVNDSWGNGQLMYMPQMTSLNPNVDAIEGLLVNPMPHNQASKVAIFQALDYSWNIKGFNSTKSYEKSFYTIEKDEVLAQELYTFASNLQTGPEFVNGWIPRQNELESPLFVDIVNPLLEATKTNKFIGDEATFKVLDPIKEGLENVVSSIEKYSANATNKELVEELDAHMKSLKDLCNGGLMLLDVNITLIENKGTKAELLNEINVAMNAIRDSQRKYMVQNVAYPNFAESGILVLQPFFETLNKQLVEIINTLN